MEINGYPSLCWPRVNPEERNTLAEASHALYNKIYLVNLRL